MTLLDEVQQLTGEPLLRFFAYEHLPEKLQTASKPFAILAMDIAQRQTKQPERTVALRKLLEAKDASVRCELP